jgi:hypothetical protein
MSISSSGIVTLLEGLERGFSERASTMPITAILDAPAGAVRDDAIEEKDAPEDESPAGALERRRVVERRRLVLEAEVLDDADGPEG